MTNEPPEWAACRQRTEEEGAALDALTSPPPVVHWDGSTLTIGDASVTAVDHERY